MVPIRGLLELVFNAKVFDYLQPNIEMNWNLLKFLPELAACQTNFNVCLILTVSTPVCALLSFLVSVCTC